MTGTGTQTQTQTWTTGVTTIALLVLRTGELKTYMWDLFDRCGSVWESNTFLWGLRLAGLEFNGPVNTIKVMSCQSVYLTTLFLGRLTSLSGWPVLCTFFQQQILTLVMLNKLRCHAHFWFSANQITWSRLLIQIHIPDDKQCRFRSVGFFRSQLIWIYTVYEGRVYLGSAGQGLRQEGYGMRVSKYY